MSVLGASRFTALLAAIAISGMAGTFWWALETRSDMKEAAGNRGASRAMPPKFTGRVARAKDERPGKSEPNRSEPGRPDFGRSDSTKFELMGNSERPLPASVGSAGRSNDQDSDRSAPLLANYPVGPGTSRSMQIPGLQAASASTLGTSTLGTSTLGTSTLGTGTLGTGPQTSGSPSAVAPSQVAAGNRADMPLPALPALPPARPEPTPWQQTMSSDSPTLLPALPSTATRQPVDTQKRQARSTIPAAPAAARAAKPHGPGYYMEQYLEQGETRVRRRPCEPPNMPDVCFMPQTDRQVVVARP